MLNHVVLMGRLTADPELHMIDNEIQIFVQQLVEGIHMELDKDGMISAYTFECEQDFDTKRLLWACMDLLIKADLTISEIKKERMKLLHRVAPSEI